MTILHDSRPVAIDVQPDGIPAEMKARRQWVCWRYEPDGNGRPTKVPYQPNGRKASSTDANTWGSFADAFDAYCNSHSNFSGIGYVFSGEPDDFVGVDLDDVRDAETGELHPWRPDQRRCDRWVDDAPEPAEIITMLASYAEISPSLSGVKVFVRGDLAQGGKAGDFEAYSRGRYFTVTGMKLRESPATITTVNGELNDVTSKFLRIVPRDEGSQPAVTVDVPDNSTPADDDALIEAATANDIKFRQLWSGDTTGYASHSEADLALCNLLAVLCNGSAARVDRLFRRSALMRPKWDERRGVATYGTMTVAKAVAKASGTAGTPNTDGRLSLWSADARTELANARRFTTSFGDQIRYCAKLAAWFVYDGTRWKRDEALAVEALFKATADELWGEVTKIAKDCENKQLVQSLIAFAKASSSANGVRNALSLARSEPGIAIEADILDRDPLLLNTLSGTVDLRTGELRPHRREDMITKLAPVAFNPDAECPLWRKFLGEVFGGNVELIEFVQRAAGYSLTGDTSERCLFFLHGKGRNGKTTLVETLRKLLGDYATTLTTDLLTVGKFKTIPAEVVDLFGARMAVASETEDGSQLAEAFIKAATGGEDRLKGRRPYEQFVEFSPTHKLWVCGNHKPRIRGTDDAVWDRIRLIPFGVRFEKPDKQLAAKLAAEGEGILRWCVEGAMAWRRNGLGEAKAVAEAVAGYRKEEDICGRFVEDCCTIDPKGETFVSVLLTAFERWCQRNGEHCPGGRVLGARLTEMGFGTRRSTGGKTLRTGLTPICPHLDEEEQRQYGEHLASREGVAE